MSLAVTEIIIYAFQLENFILVFFWGLKMAPRLFDSTLKTMHKNLTLVSQLQKVLVVVTSGPFVGGGYHELKAALVTELRLQLRLSTSGKSRHQALVTELRLQLRLSTSSGKSRRQALVTELRLQLRLSTSSSNSGNAPTRWWLTSTSEKTSIYPGKGE